MNGSLSWIVKYSINEDNNTLQIINFCQNILLFRCLSSITHRLLTAEILQVEAADAEDSFSRGGTLSKVFIESYAVKPIATEGTTCKCRNCLNSETSPYDVTCKLTIGLLLPYVPLERNLFLLHGLAVLKVLRRFEIHNAT